MIFKLIILAAVVYVVYVLFFRDGNLLDKVKEQKGKMSKRKKEEDIETVVECHACGVFVSVEEAILKDGHYYCSKKCAGIK
jgi:uncharacterized protein